MKSPGYKNSGVMCFFFPIKENPTINTQALLSSFPIWTFGFDWMVHAVGVAI